MDPDGAPRQGSVLLPVLFGFALPGLVSWIPLTVAGALSSAIHPVAGYAFAALAMASGGILTTRHDSSSRSPWLLAERSIGRFARLADLLRTERKARQPLLLFCALFSLAMTSLAWRIPGSEPSQESETDTVSWIPDTWAPGFAPKPDRLPAGDGRAVTILYDVPRAKVEEFHEAIAIAGRFRRREGGLQWRLASDLENPGRLTES
jgi:hypothetical protein